MGRKSRDRTVKGARTTRESTELLDSMLGRRRFLGTALKLAAAPALAQALAMGSVGRALAQAPAPNQTLRLAYTNPITAFDTGREAGSPELHLLLFDGLTFYNWVTHITEPVIASSWD